MVVDIFLQQRLALFKHQPYLLYVIACFFVNVGGGISYITLAWLLLQYHAGISSVMVLMMCYWIPSALLGPFSGVLVDRYSRRAMMLFSSAMRGILWLVFGWIMLQHYHPLLIYIFSGVGAVFMTIAQPASATIMRELVPEDQLLFGNANLDMAYELGNLIGFGGAGFIIAWIGAIKAVMLNGLFFGLAVMCLAIMRYRKPIKSVAKITIKHVWAELLEGLCYIGQHRKIRMIYSAQLLVFVAALTAPILMAPYAKIILHATSTQFGQIEAAISVGLLVAGLFLPWLAEKFGIERVAMVFSIVGAASFFGFVFEQTILAAEYLYFIVGLFYATWPLLMARAQQLTDFKYQGRTQSSFNSLASVVILLVYVLVALLGQVFGLHALYLLEVVVALLAAIILLLSNKKP